jgi:hypothetical protein
MAYRAMIKNPLIKVLSKPSALLTYLYNDKQNRPDKQFHGTAYRYGRLQFVEWYKLPYIFPPIWYLANDQWSPQEVIREQDLPAELGVSAPTGQKTSILNL